MKNSLKTMKIINFTGYCSPLKKYFRKGLMPTVQRGLYGDILTKENLSIEHLIPRSYGGLTETSNLALASKRMNNLRGNQPLQDFLIPKKAIDYLLQFKDINLPEFNGNDYITYLLDLFHRLKIV